MTNEQQWSFYQMNGYVWLSEFARATVPMYHKLCGLNNNKFFLTFKNLRFIYFFLAAMGLFCDSGLSLVVTSVDYTLAAVCGLLVAVASLVAKYGL